MSNNKVMKARLQMKCDVASNWDNAKDTFIPYKGEIIFTQETANGPITEMRIGDGVSTYGQLPVFTDNYDIDTTYDLAAAKSKSNGDVTIDLTAGGSGSGTDSVKIKGSGATTVTTDESGVITIDSTDTQQFTITANAEDDNVVILSGTSGINSVSYKAEHAKKGPNTTKGATADVTVDAAGESGTIKIPKVTVDEYGHTTGLTEQTLLIEIPNSIKNPNALSIGGKTYDGSSAVSITAADLGIDNALHFIGITTTAITDNATTNPIKVNGNNHTAVAGDVVLYNDNEYVFDGSKWLELGDGSSHALKTNTITAGKGLTDGGAIGNNPTINVGQGNGITVTDDAVAAKAGNGITVDSTGINHADTSSQSSIAADGRKYITGVTLDIYGHVTGLTTGTETVTDTNTAHSHSVGTGLKMTPITDAGGIDGDVKYEANLKSASSLGTIGSTSKLYAVGVDSNGNLAVNVPWTDTNTQDGNDNQTVTTGGVTFGANDPVEFVAGSNVTISGDASTKKITINSTDTNTWRKVQLNGVDKLGTGTNTKPLNIKAGNNVTITEENGTFTFSATGTNTDTGKTYTAKSDSLITIDDTEIGTKYITPGTADNSVEIFDGVANQQYSIAIGTNDKTALAAIVGSTAANSISTDVPTASGVGSLAMGGGAKAVTAGGQALGALNTSGVKG